MDWLHFEDCGLGIICQCGYIDLSDHPCCKLLQVSPLELALDGVIEMKDGDS